ncbi:hypothetical protein Aeh1ORF151c [Aeromonas phage Aeh1]|uniref:Uncharacterized protein n=1 Tax=Aeromonas phage Aeh1 TaxID=2880362 RepID=Q76YT0_9CAUD|nr:hypothetical protein Aeh1p161 [Aeromonas phage Aeh1]AAQ17816.1 hypothetical protein Aeh1ORF151c [Aeromonas phage Aeh1]
MSSIIEFILANVKMYGDAMAKIHKMDFKADDVSFNLNKKEIIVKFDADGKELEHKFEMDFFRDQASVSSWIKQVEDFLKQVNGE